MENNNVIMSTTGYHVWNKHTVLYAMAEGHTFENLDQNTLI